MSTKTTQLEIIINGEPYLKAEKAQETLQMTYSALRNQVIAGNIKKDYPPGSKQAYYRKKDVENLAEARGLIKPSSMEEKHTIFRKATKEDIPICVRLGTESYPQYSQEPASVETRLTWLDKNPDLFYVVTHKGEIVGYTGIIPMTTEKIIRVLDDKYLFKDIKAEEIENLQPGKTYNIYINTMRTKINISRLEKRTYGVRLIEGLIIVILAMIRRGINFDTLYARSETVDGIRLLKRLNFQEIPSVTRYKNYALKVDHNNIQNLQRYQQASEKRHTKMRGNP